MVGFEGDQGAAAALSEARVSMRRQLCSGADIGQRNVGAMDGGRLSGGGGVGRMQFVVAIKRQAVEVHVCSAEGRSSGLGGSPGAVGWLQPPATAEWPVIQGHRRMCSGAGVSPVVVPSPAGVALRGSVPPMGGGDCTTSIRTSYEYKHPWMHPGPGKRKIPAPTSDFGRFGHC